jgi:bifunctional non-homologous end joining protein LigD
MATQFAIPLTEPPAPSYQEERTELYFREGSSDKVYHCNLTQSEAGWTFLVERGPRRGPIIHDVKLSGVSYEAAKKLYDKTVRGQLSKGYQDPRNSPQNGEEKKPAASSGAIDSLLMQRPVAVRPEKAPPLTSSRGPVSHEIVFQPELLTRVTEKEAQDLARNPQYFFQTKQDGDRLTIRVAGSLIHGFNKLGQIVRLDQRLHDAIHRLTVPNGITSLTMDGEWEADGFHAWDLIECRRASDTEEMPSLRHIAYEYRLETLEVFLSDLVPELAGLLHLTYTARSTEEKQALLARTDLEGVAIKLRSASFRPGRNGQHKKYKHEQDASFIVGPKPPDKLNDGKRSVALYIHDPEAKWHSDWQLEGSASLRYVCTVKVPEKYEMPGVMGTVIDVRYLYAYHGGGIAQPCYFGKVRNDVRREDCTIAQLKFKREGDTDDEA